jgi:hypothetical protein
VGPLEEGETEKTTNDHRRDSIPITYGTSRLSLWKFETFLAALRTTFRGGKRRGHKGRARPRRGASNNGLPSRSIPKTKIAVRHDTKVDKRDFEVGSLVLKRNAKVSHEGKLAPNWEGPYRVRGETGGGAYHLETLLGKELPRTWNAKN